MMSPKFKTFSMVLIALSMLSSIALAQTHPLSEITPIDVNLDLYFILSLFLIFLLYIIAAKLPKLSRRISLLITLVLFGVSIYLLLTYTPKIVLNLESFITGLLTGFVVYVFGKFIILVKKQLINVWGLFLEGVIIAPIVEELLFRFGVITVLFKTSLFGILTSVVLWSLAHYLGEHLTKLTKYHRSIYGISHTFFSGSLFAIIYIITDFNLFTSIFAHSFYNFLIWIFALAPQLNISTSLHSVLKVKPLISLTSLFSTPPPKLRININTFKVIVFSSAIVFSILIFPAALAQTQSSLSEITNVSYAGVLALPLITAFRRKRKLTFDIDVASVHVWMEKDARKKEAKDFFDFLRLKEKEFELIASKHTLDQIATWKNKTIVSKLISLFKDFCKTVDPDKIIRNFEKERGIKIKEFSENFAKEAKIKTEDALAIIVYSLLGAEYFVTFNKKHLRNKYAKLKEVGWKFGIEIPEIMLPHEFVSLFSKLSEQSSRSFSSKHDSKLNRILFSSFKPSFHNFRLTSSIFKTLLSVITLTLFSSLALAQTQSHPLSEITPIDVNLDMFQKNITNVSYLGIGLTSPLYPLDVAGSGRISSNLYIGTAGRYLYDTGSVIGVSSGLLLGGNLNLNSYSLISGNWLNASNLNVSQVC
ncbi:MAG: type II CAAX endopeptidase family protein, partial [Candidatus Aenigmatarchaeota archaeon]